MGDLRSQYDRGSIDFHDMNPTGRGYRIPMPSGIYVYPEDPRPNEFNIYDIAHKLAFQCRYGGGCSHYYSVAEHSWNLSYLVPNHLALDALLHDRGESWLQDFLRPVKKKAQPWYGIMERRIEEVSAPVFGVTYPNHPTVMQADIRICIDEKKQLYTCGYTSENAVEDAGEGFGIKLNCWGPYEARDMFLHRYTQLTGDLSWQDYVIPRPTMPDSPHIPVLR